MWVQRKILGLVIIMSFVSSVQAVLPMADAQGRSLPTLAPLLQEVNPAVVNIATYANHPLPQNPLMNDPFFRHFFNAPGRAHPQSRRTQSAGSGVIVDAKAGTVVTNHHVIRGANEIVVSLKDGRTFKAKLLGSDPEVDIAVLALEEFDGLTGLPMADSDRLRVGDFVIAIGNPFGLGQSVTSGIVSALGRGGLGIEGYESFIQTDASINPGNSGGALINLRGELVGINTAILSPAGGNIGIGFAIPMNMAKVSIDQILQHGEVKRGRLGVVIQDLTTDLAAAFDIDSQQRGVIIAEVQQGSEADEAGLMASDVVISIDAKSVVSAVALRNEIGLRQVGDTVKLTILRDGRTQIVKVTVGDMSSPVLAEKGSSLNQYLQGAHFASHYSGGVEIIEVEPKSKVAQYGLLVGDVILSANHQSVNSIQELIHAANSSSSRLVLRVKRGGAALYVVLQ